jgi:hypothetical protein
MTEIIEEVMNGVPLVQKPTLKDYHSSDQEAREMARSMIRRKSA